MRAALVQMRSGLDPARNAADAVRAVEAAAAEGADFVCTPEMTGLVDRDAARMSAAITKEEMDPCLAALKRAAAASSVWIAIGSLAVEAEAPGKAANRSFLIAPDGSVAARYDKAHLFDADVGGEERYRESAAYAAGDRIVHAEGPDGWRLGFGICYDIRFPEFYRALARMGAEILLAPSAFTAPTGEAHWETLLRARAIEGGAYVLAAAQGGLHEDGRRTWGRSMIVDPWGSVVATAPDDAPTIIHADLDRRAVVRARERIPAWRMRAAAT